MDKILHSWAIQIQIWMSTHQTEYHTCCLDKCDHLVERLQLQVGFTWKHLHQGKKLSKCIKAHIQSDSSWAPLRRTSVPREWSPPCPTASTSPESLSIPPLPVFPGILASLGLPPNTPLPYGANIAFMWSPSGNTLSPVLLQGNITIIPCPLPSMVPTPSALLPWHVAAALPVPSIPIARGASVGFSWEWDEWWAVKVMVEGNHIKGTVWPCVTQSYWPANATRPVKPVLWVWVEWGLQTCIPYPHPPVTCSTNLHGFINLWNPLVIVFIGICHEM